MNFSLISLVKASANTGFLQGRGSRFHKKYSKNYRLQDSRKRITRLSKVNNFGPYNKNFKPYQQKYGIIGRPTFRHSQSTRPKIRRRKSYIQDRSDSLKLSDLVGGGENPTEHVYKFHKGVLNCVPKDQQPDELIRGLTDSTTFSQPINKKHEKLQKTKSLYLESLANTDQQLYENTTKNMQITSYVSRDDTDPIASDYWNIWNFKGSKLTRPLNFCFLSWLCLA